MVAVASLLHDLGLTGHFPGQRRFETEGADAARTFVREQIRARNDAECAPMPDHRRTINTIVSMVCDIDLRSGVPGGVRVNRSSPAGTVRGAPHC